MILWSPYTTVHCCHHCPALPTQPSKRGSSHSRRFNTDMPLGTQPGICAKRPHKAPEAVRCPATGPSLPPQLYPRDALGRHVPAHEHQSISRGQLGDRALGVLQRICGGTNGGAMDSAHVYKAIPEGSNGIDMGGGCPRAKWDTVIYVNNCHGSGRQQDTIAADQGAPGRDTPMTCQNGGVWSGMPWT